MPADARARSRERPAVRAEKLFGENAVQRRPATSGTRAQPDGVGISGTIRASDPIRAAMAQLGPPPGSRAAGGSDRLASGAARPAARHRAGSSSGARIYNQKPMSADALRVLSPLPSAPRREFVTDLRSPVINSALDRRCVSPAQPLMVEQGRKLAPFSRTTPAVKARRPATDGNGEQNPGSVLDEAATDAGQELPAPQASIVFSANTTIRSENARWPGPRRPQHPRQTPVDRHMVKHGDAHFSPRDVTEAHRQQSSLLRQPPKADVLIRGASRTYAEVRPHSTAGVFGFNTQTGSFLRTLVSPEAADAGAWRRAGWEEPAFAVENETHTTTVQWPGHAGGEENGPESPAPAHHRSPSSVWAGGSPDVQSPFPVHERLGGASGTVATRPRTVNSRRGSRSHHAAKGRRTSGGAVLEGRVMVPDRPKTALHQSFSEVTPWDS